MQADTPQNYQKTEGKLSFQGKAKGITKREFIKAAGVVGTGVVFGLNPFNARNAYAANSGSNFMLFLLAIYLCGKEMSFDWDNKVILATHPYDGPGYPTQIHIQNGAITATHPYDGPGYPTQIHIQNGAITATHPYDGPGYPTRMVIKDLNELPKFKKSNP